MHTKPWGCHGQVEQLMILPQTLIKNKNWVLLSSSEARWKSSRLAGLMIVKAQKVFYSFLVMLQEHETFSEEAGNYFYKIKSAVRKSLQIQWSAGFEILPWRRTAGTEEHLNRQTMRRRARTVFIMSWDDSTGRCWFLCILCWPFTLGSSLLSCDLQRRSQEQVIKSPVLLEPLEIQRGTGYPECQSFYLLSPLFLYK